MLVGCFFGVVAADRTQNVWIGLAVALLAGVLLAGLHAYASITLRADQIVSGMALNILALGSVQSEVDASISQLRPLAEDTGNGAGNLTPATHG